MFWNEDPVKIMHITDFTQSLAHSKRSTVVGQT